MIWRNRHDEERRRSDQTCAIRASTTLTHSDVSAARAAHDGWRNTSADPPLMNVCP
jgi:hypothetical protein